MPVMVLKAMVFHFMAWVKLPTALIGNRLPKMNVSTLLLTVLMIEVNKILTLNGNIRLIGVKSTLNEGRQYLRV